jgi:hypothetical protein
MCKRIKMGITTGLTMTISITTRIITLKEQWLPHPLLQKTSHTDTQTGP